MGYDFRNNREYVMLHVLDPPSFRGLMRVYCDRICEVVEISDIRSYVVYALTPQPHVYKKIMLMVGMSAKEMRIRIRKAV